jgi:CpXC protein
MPSDRSIAEDRTLQCVCGEWFDVLEWHLIDVAARLDLVREIASGEQRTHRCPACGFAHGRLTPLGLLVPSPSKPASIIAVIGESGDDHAQAPAWCADVQVQMFDEPVDFVNVPWYWIVLIRTHELAIHG